MNPETLRALLERVRAGETSPDEALETLRLLPYEELGFATLDHHRALRRGFAEVVFCQGKTPAQVATIMERLAARPAAGLHRLLAQLERLRRARVVVVVAGMEGALPSVVAGLLDVPVIAVPTSVGYGAHFGGLAALLAMLNACSSGIAVVNIDNGFGAGLLAAMINRTTSTTDT